MFVGAVTLFPVRFNRFLSLRRIRCPVSRRMSGSEDSLAGQGRERQWCGVWVEVPVVSAFGSVWLLQNSVLSANG